MSERYPPIIPEDLNPEQKTVHDKLTTELEKYFGGIFTTNDAKTGALIGPYSHFLYLPPPVVGGYTGAALGMATIPGFPPKCREIAIIAIGEHFGAPFEMYSHSRIGKKVGLSDIQIKDVLDGKPPSEATEQELVSWEVARALIGAGGAKRGPLSPELWQRAEKALGKAGAGALIHYTGFYMWTSAILNGTGVPVPEGENIWPIPE